MFTFKVSVFMYRLVNIFWRTFTIILAIMSYILANQLSGKQGEELRKIQKRNTVVWVCFLILSFALLVLDFKQVYNLEDVFEGRCQYVGQTLKGKADGYGRKYGLEGNYSGEGEEYLNDIMIYKGRA